jgi:hypothetical protein
LQTTTAIPGLHKFMGIADERVKDVRIENEMLSVDLLDGRIISVPLAWYPKLFNASQEELEKWEIAGGGYGLHWLDLDEDLSTEGSFTLSASSFLFQLTHLQ